MRRVFEHAARGSMSASMSPLGMFCVVTGTLLALMMFALPITARSVACAPDGCQLIIGPDLLLELRLLVGFAAAFFAWAGLHALGFLGAGSGAGFRLMLGGVSAHVLTATSRLLAGGCSADLIYDVLPHAGLTPRVVDLGLVAYGCGAALVVTASSVDFLRWRRTAAWIRALP